MDVLASFGVWQFLLTWAIIAVCVLLMLVILVQKGRGSGLSGAFGGGGGGSSAFGAKTGDVFTWITVGLAALFIVSAVAANYVLDESPTAMAEREQASEATGGSETPETPPADTAPGESTGTELPVGADPGATTNAPPAPEEGAGETTPASPKPVEPAAPGPGAAEDGNS
jgi:preprotein translocase subunit SecG